MMLCVTDAHFVKSFGAKLLKRFVKLDPHFIELFIRRVSEPENGVAHTFKRLRVSLVSKSCLKPFIE